MVIFFSKKVIFVKVMKSMALMGMGAGAVLAYQKYNKPMMKKVEKMVNRAKEKAVDGLDELENMME